MAKLSDRILGERVSGYVTKPNLLDNSNGQIHQRGVGPASSGGYYLDQWTTRLEGDVGGTCTIQSRAISSSDRTRFIRLTCAGNTTTTYIGQQIRPELFTFGADYTFSVKLGALPVEGSVGAMRVYARSGGTFYELHIEDVVLNSQETVSITFNYAPTVDLSGAADCIVVRFQPTTSGPAADGNWAVRGFKLEEGNVFTGYEPTPYAIDEAECMKWYQVPFDTTSISPFYANIYRSAGSAGAQDHVMNAQIRPKMYLSPVVVDESYVGAVAPDSVQTNQNSLRVLWTNTASPTAEVGVDNLALSCEL